MSLRQENRVLTISGTISGRERRGHNSFLDRGCFSCGHSLRHLRHRPHQSLGVFVLRTGQDLLGAPADLCFVQDCNSVAVPATKADRVRYTGSPSEAAVECAKQRQNLGLRNHIECARSLIRNQQRRPMHHGHRNQDSGPDLHSSAVLPEKLVTRWEAYALQS